MLVLDMRGPEFVGGTAEDFAVFTCRYLDGGRARSCDMELESKATMGTKGR